MSPLLACLLGSPDELHESLALASDLPLLALRHGVVTLLYQQLRQHDLLSRLPDDQRAQLKSLHLMAMERRLRRLDAAAELSQALAQAHFTRYLPLKGWAVLASGGSSPLLREMIDLDLLVSPADAQEVYDLLQQAGCRVADMPWIPTPWEYHLPRLELRSVPIELHWRLWPHSPLQPFALPDFEALHSRAIAGRLEGQTFMVPSVEDQFLIQAAGLAEDGFTTCLRGWADLYWLLQLLPPDGGQLWNLAVAARMHGYALVMLSLLHELLQCDLPVQSHLPAELHPIRNALGEIAWRRLWMADTKRASTWMLTGIYRLRHRRRWYASSWGKELPEWLQSEVRGGPAGWAVLHAGGAVAAGLKVAARLGRLAVVPSERRAVREDLRLVHLLHGLANKVG
ncbi:MAG: nucleotidyltransferase family protein [Armatimonadia bacterium]